MAQTLVARPVEVAGWQGPMRDHRLQPATHEEAVALATALLLKGGKLKTRRRSRDVAVMVFGPWAHGPKGLAPFASVVWLIDTP